MMKRPAWARTTEIGIGALPPLRPLNQLDLVPVRILHERDHRGPTLDRPRLARHGAARIAHLLAGGRHVGHADGHVAEAGAELIVIDAVVVGELEHGVLGLVSIPHEGQCVLLIGPVGGAQEVHAQGPGVEVDRALKVADPKHRVQHSHWDTSVVAGSIRRHASVTAAARRAPRP